MPPTLEEIHYNLFGLHSTITDQCKVVHHREWVTASLRTIAYDTPFSLARTFASYITSDFS